MSSGGDLHTCIYNAAEQTGHGLNITYTRFVAAEILSALQYIHEQGIVFQDLKPENVVFVQGHAKLTDFGCAIHLTDLAQNQSARLEGTREYLAPELHKGSQNASFASDVFALGCIIYQMLTAKEPEFCIEAGQDRVVRFEIDKERIFTEDFPPEARDLIEHMCAFDPTHRLSLNDVKRHPFFAGIDFAGLIHQKPPSSVSTEPGIKVSADQRWQRRHNSIMWAPDMPKYKFQQEGGALPCIEEVPLEHEQHSTSV